MEFFNLFLIILAFIFSVGCQKKTENVSGQEEEFSIDCSPGEKSTFGIISGKTVAENSPISKSIFLIKTNFGSEGEAFCTASLIGKDTLLTAAHCVVSKSKNFVSQNGKVFFSANPACSQKNNQLLSTSYEKVVVYSKYLEEAKITKNDFAVIYLNSNMPSGLVPLKVSKEFPIEWKIDQLFAIGYGNSKGYSAFDANPVRLRVTKFEKSQITKKSFSNASNGTITIEQSTSGICSGDSGGPLIEMNSLGEVQIIGIASTVSNDSDQKEICSGYANYRSTDEIYNWLQKLPQH